MRALGIASSVALAMVIVSVDARAQETVAQQWDDSVDVHITSARTVELQRLVSGNAVLICTAPCSAQLDAKGRYRVAGASVTPSSEFKLPSDAASLDLTVKAGSSVRHGVGAGLAGVGGLLLVSVPMILLTLGKDPTEQVDKPGSAERIDREKASASSARIAAFVTLPVGALLLVFGVALVIGERTEVKSGTGQRIAEARIQLPGKVAVTYSGVEF